MDTSKEKLIDIKEFLHSFFGNESIYESSDDERILKKWEYDNHISYSTINKLESLLIHSDKKRRTAKRTDIEPSTDRKSNYPSIIVSSRIEKERDS